MVDPTDITSTGAHALKATHAMEEVEHAVDSARTAVKVVNGNSKASKSLQHGYEIFEKGTGNVVKTGVSGGKLNINGTSRRAISQVNKWNKVAGYQKYDSRVVVKNIPGRDKILKWEKLNAERLKKSNNMYKHSRP